MDETREKWEHDGFVRSPRPFHDFIIISGLSQPKPDKPETGILEKLRNFRKKGESGTREIGPLNFLDNCSFFSRYPLFDSTVLYSSFPLYKNRLICGYAFRSSGFLYGAIKHEDPEFDEMAETTGNFTYIQCETDSVRACQDFFGMGSLFYYSGNNLAIISNRAHLIAITLANLNLNPDLNQPFISSLALFSYLFKDQSFNNDTPIKNLNYLGRNHYIILNKDGLSIQKKNYEDINHSYDDLIQKGKEDICNNIKSLMKEFPDAHYHMDLSGGKDSRMLFGAITNVPEIKGKLDIVTLDVKESQDLSVSLALTSHFGYPYRKKHNYKTRYLPKEFNYALWRSYFMGLYNRMPRSFHTSPSYAGTAEEKIRDISLSGGLGEIYRNYLHNVFDKKKGVTFEEKITQYFEDSSYTKGLDRERFSRLKEYFLDNMKEYLKYSINEGMQRFYEDSRARKHFGLRIFNFFHGVPIIHPLQSKNLYYANKLLSEEDQIAARAIYDLTKAFNPVLPSFDYWKEWDYARKNSAKSPQIDNQKIQTKRKEWREATQGAWKSLLDLCSNKQLDSKDEEDLYCRLELAQALARIENKYPDLSKVLAHFLYIATLYYVESPARFRIMASRIFSLDDFIFPLKSMKETYPFEKFFIPKVTISLEEKDGKISALKIDFENTLNEADYEVCYYGMAKDKIVYREYIYKDNKYIPVSEKCLAKSPDSFKVFLRHKSSKSTFVNVMKI